MKKLQSQTFCYILLLYGIFSFSLANAQQEEPGNIDRYLDDGGISTARNFVKLNLSSVYQGDLHFSVERLFGKNFSLEGGVGLLAGYYNDDPLSAIFNPGESTLSEPKMGFSLSLSPRIYRKGFDSYYVGIPARARFFPGQLQLYEVSIAAGKQWVWNNGLVIDISIGFGIQHQKSADDKTYAFHAENLTEYNGLIEGSLPDKNRPIMPIQIKIGYRF